MEPNGRTAQAAWTGDLRNGNGKISTTSAAIKQVDYTFKTRFENEPGTNPEELIAAAHAACYSMAFAGLLARKGHTPERIQTKATCFLRRTDNGFEIFKMRLDVTGSVPGIDEQMFKQEAKEADKGCPVSNLLRCGLEIEINVSLSS